MWSLLTRNLHKLCYLKGKRGQSDDQQKGRGDLQSSRVDVRIDGLWAQDGRSSPEATRSS